MPNEKAPPQGHETARKSPKQDRNSAKKLTREERLAQALRDNLRRRKAPQPSKEED